MPRDNQRNRTRKDLLEAALRLSAKGDKPTLEQVAAEALVSRATAYRYFRNADDLLLEASLHMAFPDAERIFQANEVDAVARLKLADEAVEGMIRDNEISLRLMMANAIRQAASSNDLPVRQNRRMPLIEAALDPVARTIDRKSLARLKSALSLIIGTEAMLVLKDVLRLSDKDAKDVRHWALQALVDAALAPKKS